MTRTWLIKEYMSDCPLGWQRFIEELQSRLPFNSRFGFSIEIINSELEQYRARYYESGRNGFVDFYDDAFYTLFVLKYGGKNEEQLY